MSIKVALFRTSTEIYLFKLESDGTFEVLSGDRYTDDFTDSNNIDVVKTESKILTEYQLTELNQLLSQIQNFEQSDRVVRGGWEVIINYDGEKYRFTYGAAKDKNLDAFVTMLIQNSPFKIADNAGNAVNPVKVEEVE